MSVDQLKTRLPILKQIINVEV